MQLLIDGDGTKECHKYLHERGWRLIQKRTSFTYTRWLGSPLSSLFNLFNTVIIHGLMGFRTWILSFSVFFESGEMIEKENELGGMSICVILFRKFYVRELQWSQIYIYCWVDLDFERKVVFSYISYNGIWIQ